MKTNTICLYLGMTVAALAGESVPAQEDGATNYAYDDRRIAQIRRGETTEARLLEWFGSPDSRELKPDGGFWFLWSFASRPDQEPGEAGILTVHLGSEGTVESYAAQRRAVLEQRTVELADRSETALREYQAQWKREGWAVLSLSAASSAESATPQRRAVLSRRRGGPSSTRAYDDRQIAKLQRGATGEPELLEWFGPPERRDVKQNGCAQLSWGFDDRGDGGAGHSGTLSVELAPDGKVVSYTARRGPR